MHKSVAPFGLWTSSITPGLVAGKALRFGLVQGSGDWVYWSESRPEEQGRSAIMRCRPQAAPEEILGAPFSARSRVHEYGGGEFCVSGERVYFANDADQDLYFIDPGGAPVRLTYAPDMRFADLCYDPHRRTLLAVGERTVGGATYPENLLVAVDASACAQDVVRELATGHDFYAFPRLSPDGSRLAWIAWRLPDMPWDQAELWVAKVSEDGTPVDRQQIAGGDGVAVFQPEWVDDATLLFVSDESGTGRLKRWTGASPNDVATARGDLSRPLWGLGTRSYAVADDGTICAAALDDGELSLSLTQPEGALHTVGESGLRGLQNLSAFNDGFAALGTSDLEAPAVVALDRDCQAVTVLRRGAQVDLDSEGISVGEVLSLTGNDGAPVYGVYYPPANAHTQGPRGALPPAIVTVHGGPTGAADRGLKLKTQYWTSRGFAVFDLDFAGSTGYGRAYRERLDGKWGLADTADALAAAHHLGDSGRADPERIAISGGSSGGYTVLMALVAGDTFAAGACYYGISDLKQLLRFTHKFESGYLYRLLGITPDNCQATFHDRSPLAHVDRIRSPVIVFQGLEDKVVPPAQSRMIVKALKRRKVAVEYHEFEGEGHGFRRADTLQTALSREYAFFLGAMGIQATA